MKIIKFRRNNGDKMLECMQKGLKHFNKALEYVEDAMEESLDERYDDDDDYDEDRQRRLPRRGMSNGRYSRN